MGTGKPMDVIASIPDEIKNYKDKTGEYPNDIKVEKGYYCIWNDRYFIHTRAVLPLKDFENGVGYGLWVEVKKDDFDKYLEAEKDAEKYKNFQVEGTLANIWPGFENIFGIKVKIKTVNVEEKVYISEVYLDKPRDPAFEVALNTQVGDKEGVESIRKLAYSYTKSVGNKLH